MSCQRGFIFSISEPFFAAASPLAVSRDESLSNVIVRLVIDQTMHFVFLGESLDGIHFVLQDAAIEITGDAHVKRAGAAGQDVNPKPVMETVAHGKRS